MTLPSSILQFPLKFGLQEGLDPKQAPPGTLTRATNVVWHKSGLLEKRLGMRLLGIVGNLPARLFTRADGRELCAIDGTSVLSLNEPAGTFAAIASVPDIGLTQTAIADPFQGLQSSDTAISGDVAVTAIVTGDPTLGSIVAAGLSIMITSVSTGRSFLPLTEIIPASAALNFGVRVVMMAGGIAIVLCSGNDATIRAFIVNTNTLAISGSVAIRGDRSLGAFQNWDARIVGASGGTLFVLAYYNGANIRLTTYDVSLAVQQTALQAPAAAPIQLAVDGTAGESVCVTYSVGGTNNVYAYIADPTTMVTTAGPTLVNNTGIAIRQIGVCRYDATNYAIVYTRVPAAGATTIAVTESKMFTSAGALVLNSRRSTAGVALVSNPFVVNAKCYVFAANAGGVNTTTGLATPFVGNSTVALNVWPGPDDGTSVTTDLTHPYCANVDTLLGATNTIRSCLPVFNVISATKAIGSLPFIGIAPNSQFNWKCSIRMLTVTAGADVPVDLWRCVSHGAEAFISGPVMTVYDGGDVFDYCFNYAPVLMTQVTAGAGGFITAGNYFYGAHLEYRGASGLIYRSPVVAGPVLPTAGATSANTLRLSNYNVGNKKHLQLERFSTSMPVFRTIAGGANLQRLTEEPSYNLSPCTYSATTLTYVDTRADTAIDPNSITLAARPVIYTSGGILDDRQPPAGLTLFFHKSRLWTLANNSTEWWFSKSFQDDLGYAPGFHFKFRIFFEEAQIGGASMDEKAIFFSKTSIAYLNGEGPTPDGSNSDYGTPSRVQTDTGCINARSIISMQDGVMFQGVKGGLYLLNRDLTIEWVGRVVQDQLDAFPTITSAVQLPDKNEVRFSCNNGITGIVLVYNYFEKQWTTLQYTLGGVLGPAIADATVYNDRYTVMTYFGWVYTEDPSTYLDGGIGGAWVTMDVETAEIYAEGPLSFQRVRRAYLKGSQLSDCDVTISAASNGVTAYDQIKAWTSNEIAALATANIGIHVKRQRCSSFRLRITDAAPSSPGTLPGLGRGINLSAIGFEIAPQPGLDRRGAGARK